jgi:WD40 repeat protein
VFDRDAHWLASGADELIVYDVAKQSVIRTLEQPSWVTAIAFHPTDRRVATGHDDGIVRIWNLDAEDDLVELAHHDEAISALAYTSDGTLLAAASEDRTISLWNTADQKLVRTLTGHTDRIPALAWKPGERLLISAGWDTTARVWNVDTGEPLLLLNTHADQVSALAFSPDGELLAVADSAASIHVWNEIAKGQELRVLPGDHEEVRSIVFTQNGNRLLVGGSDRVIHVWDPRSGDLVSGQGRQWDHRLGLNSKSGILVSTAAATQLRCWDIATGRRVPPDGLVPKPIAVAVSPDGRWSAATNSNPESRLHVWDHEANRMHPPVEGPRAPMTNLAFSPNSKTLASCCRNDGTTWLWNPADGEPKLIIPEATEGCSVEAIAFHPNNVWLACAGIDWLATGGSDGVVSIWDTESRSRLMSFDAGGIGLAFDKNGDRLAVAGLDGVLRVIDLTNQQVAKEIEAGADLCAVAYSPNGKWITAGCEDHTLRVWDAQSGRSVCFDPNGKTVYTANGNSTCMALAFDALLTP